MKLTSKGIAHPLARSALDAGYHWVTTPDVPPGSVIAWPAGAVDAFRDWATLNLIDADNLLPHEELSLWLMMQGALLWHPVPSLVADARYTVQPTADMASINWDGDALHAGRQTDAHKLLLTRVRGERLSLVRRYYQLAGDEPR